MVLINIFFIVLDLAKGVAHTKLSFLQIHQNCTSLSLYWAAAYGFGMICSIKFCLIQNTFHKSYISPYIFHGLLESVDFGLLFDKLSLIIMFKNRLRK